MTKNITLIILSIYCIFFFACTPNAANMQTQTTPLDPKDWTMLNVPNGTDKVGTVFAVDKKGGITYLGILDIKTQSSNAGISQRFDDRHVGTDLLFSFLKVPSLDSAASVNGSTNLILKTSFVVNNPSITRYNDNLLSAFENKKKDIIDNMNFLNQQSNSIYLVTATLTSSNVDIMFDKNSQTKAGLKGIVKQIIGISGNVKISNADSSSLVYNLPEPLVLFYKLNSINVNYNTTRSDTSKILNLSLSASPVKKESL